MEFEAFEAPNECDDGQELAQQAGWTKLTADDAIDTRRTECITVARSAILGEGGNTNESSSSDWDSDSELVRGRSSGA